MKYTVTYNTAMQYEVEAHSAEEAFIKAEAAAKNREEPTRTFDPTLESIETKDKGFVNIDWERVEELRNKADYGL